MSDPLNPAQPREAPPPAVPNLDAAVYGGGLAAVGAGLALFPKTTGRGLYYLAGVGTRPPAPGVKVSPVVTYYPLFPPPFGFGSASNFGLPSNFFRYAAESAGVPGERIPDSKLFATGQNTPETRAELDRLTASVNYFEYLRTVSGKSNAEVTADYQLFLKAQLGLLGQVPSNLDIQRLTSTAETVLRKRGVAIEPLVSEVLRTRPGYISPEDAEQLYPLNPPKPMQPSSFAPQSLQPGNLLAMASAAAAEGVRRELATEYADP